MIRAVPLSYATLADQLSRRATRAVLGLRGLRNDALRSHLETCLDRQAGSENAFLADPVFEAIFGWQQARPTLGDLAGGLLNQGLVSALQEAHREGLSEDYRFPAERRPYRHQLAAWEALRETHPVRSVLVTSGTGSGKTECFLIPILNDLSDEIDRRQGDSLVGVRALFLYPLNALIKSQQDRLVAWSEPFDARLRFCLYNGDTPEQGRSPWRSQVPDRRTLRDEPPPILVTNATMLEYLLVRGEDRPILDQSQGRLSWIVLDEAHTYIGSQAAELALLLRRVVHAFGVRAEEVHFVATSATLGDGSDATRQRLAEFLADVAGIPVERVRVIEGHREVPVLDSSQESRALASLSALRTLGPAERYVALASAPAARALRAALVERPHRLTELVRLLHSEDGDLSRRQTLALLDLCAEAVSARGLPFLPLRAHLFHRTLSGVWACANPHCTGRQGTALEGEGWPFGALFLERHIQCRHCGIPVFELVQCGECGAEYLSALERHEAGEDRLAPWDHRRDEDEFQQELEPPETDEPTAEQPAASTATKAHERLLSSGAAASSTRLSADGVLHWNGGDGIVVHLLTPDKDGCVLCGEVGHPGRPLFRPLRIGAPFLLSTAVPTLFEHLPELQDRKEVRPLGGRRLISFTDSRQGTARFAAKLQQEAERNYVRGLLYHSLAAARAPADPARLDKLKAELVSLEAVASANSILANLVKEKRKELEDLEGPTLNRMPWIEMEEKLLQSDDFKRFLLPALRDLTYDQDQLNERLMARLCLLREFFLRPRRQFSLEGLGLAQLKYPAIERAEPPAVMRSLGVSVEDWRALLQVAIDYFLRSGSPCVAVGPDTPRWLGYPGRPSWQLAPEAKKGEPRHQRLWPSACAPHWRRNRLVRLIGRAFRWDPADREGCLRIDEVLRAIWDGVRPALTLGENGYRLELENRAELAEVAQAWLCPMTGRLLPVVFRGLTPYLPGPQAPENLTKAMPVEMPRLPHPFWAAAPAHAADEWLEGDPKVVALRKLGAWTDISDRVARHSPFFLAKEHSAQLSGSELTRYENAFKEGKINLLSCSTTMEMGVDIGGLTAVAMNNVPPHPANFLQRAGRAGRRGETKALSFTMCKATPHGEAVFRNPTWPFSTPLALPRVALQSAPIVQRHINALALGRFLKTHSERIHRLQVGWFFEAQEDESAPAERFADWCEGAAGDDDWLVEGIRALTCRTILGGLGVERLLARTVEALRRAASRWRRDLDALLAQQQGVQTRDGDSVAERAIAIQLTRLRKEYLLGELADLAFLPGYGFPTDVVSFVTTTLEDLARRQSRRDGERTRDDEREDNRARRAGYPSRNLAIAIRDYAPGTDTVLGGRVYRSGGVTLNWQLPVEANAAPEIQDLRWVWRCNACGDSGTRATMPETCPSCGAVADKLVRAQYLQPAGFAVDLRERPHNDVSLPQYIPVREPLISLEGAPWMNLPSPRLGRYRMSTEGRIFQRSDGLHGKGFALCLRCGRADSMLPNGERPKTLEGHKRLRGGRLNDKERICPGNDEEWAIRDRLTLGVATGTDVLELQLREAMTGRPVDRAAAYTLGVALRRALCKKLGIDEGEVGTAALPARDRDGEPTHSIYLYDTASGGAGYASQAPVLLPELLRDARQVLDCPRACDNACQACVLTFDSQHQIEHLNRGTALELLSQTFLDALSLPPALQAFGEHTQLEMEPLPLALSREWQRLGATELRVQLAGTPDRWEPLTWSLRYDLVRLSESGVGVRLLIPKATLVGLQDSQRDELAILAGFTGAEVYEISTAVNAGTLPICLELAAEGQAVRWAASDREALAPSSEWGSGGDGAAFVRTLSPGLPPFPPGARAIEADELRPSFTGVVEICIGPELDGPSTRFGERAWELIKDKVPTLAQWLGDHQPLAAVRYSDRYLNAPLALHLLGSLVGALTAFSGGIGKDTSVTIETARLERRSTPEPRMVYHDWSDAQDRRRVGSALLHDGEGALTWLDDSEKARLPHARHLELRWSDGREAVLRFDQGVGYWRSIGGSSAFPFAATAERQVDELHALRLHIAATSREHPTFWYASLQTPKG